MSSPEQVHQTGTGQTQPTVQQQAAIRESYASQGQSVGLATVVSENPALAAQAYAGINQPSPTLQQSPSTQPQAQQNQPTSESAADYYKSLQAQQAEYIHVVRNAENPPYSRGRVQQLETGFSRAQPRGAQIAQNQIVTQGIVSGQQDILSQPETQVGLISPAAFAKLSANQQASYLQTTGTKISTQESQLQNEISSLQVQESSYAASPTLQSYGRITGQSQEINTRLAAFNANVEIYNQEVQTFNASQGAKQAQQNNFSLRNPLEAKTALGGLEIFGGDIQNFFAGSATGYANLAKSIQTQANKAPPVTRTFETIGAGLAYEGAGFVQSLAGISGRYGNVPVNPATVTGFGVGVGTQFYLGGEAFKSFEAVTGISNLSRAGQIAVRATYGSAIGAGQSAVSSQNPLIGAGLGAASFGVGPEVVGFLKPLASRGVSYLGGKASSALDTLYERAFLQTGLAKPQIGDQEFLSQLASQYQTENFAATARSIYEQTGRGVNAYTYNPPEYRSFNTPIQNPYESLGGETSIEDFNRAIGNFKPSPTETRPSTTENVSKEGTVTLQRTVEQQQALDQVLKEQEAFIQQSQQQYFLDLALLQRARQRQKFENVYATLQYPNQELKVSPQTQTSFKFGQSDLVGFKQGFKQDFTPLQSQAFKFQYQSQQIGLSQEQGFKQITAQKELVAPKLQFQQLQLYREQGKFLFPELRTKKKRRGKKPKKKRSYKEFTNIPNLREFYLEKVKG